MIDPQPLELICSNVLGENTEPQIHPDALPLVYECYLSANANWWAGGNQFNTDMSDLNMSIFQRSYSSNDRFGSFQNIFNVVGDSCGWNMFKFV